MIVSLGNCCKVREAIQRYIKKDSLETNMFDWVISNFNSVLYFIGNINKPLIKDDFYDTKSQCYTHRIVEHKYIRFETLHDVVFNNPYKTEILILLDKYNRRLKRLHEIILSNNKLHFIHLVDFIFNPKLPNKNIYIPSLEELTTFDKLIKNINPNCNYYLHILIPPHHCKIYQTNNLSYDKNEVEKLSSNNVFIYFLTQDETIEPYLWQCRHWSWSDVFENINKL